MAKGDLFKEGQKRGSIPEDANEDDFTVAQLEGILSGNIPVHERRSADKPIIAADGHVVLSQADIDARKEEGK